MTVNICAKLKAHNMTTKQQLIKNIIKQLEELLELETPSIEID